MRSVCIHSPTCMRKRMGVQETYRLITKPVASVGCKITVAPNKSLTTFHIADLCSSFNICSRCFRRSVIRLISAAVGGGSTGLAVIATIGADETDPEDARVI